ncbi:hypothetical protein KIN_16260 [Litoreibacter roseus]|uniref:Uncharacterized protein n=1 Tax=Litoreibacter roseus TaxID=2601869 RepID=A0A6N6JH59_9RHOB|nr:hypothetical protein KIN_16260 [Litoreibacter roseus]
MGGRDLSGFVFGQNIRNVTRRRTLGKKALHDTVFIDTRRNDPDRNTRILQQGRPDFRTRCEDYVSGHVKNPVE